MPPFPPGLGWVGDDPGRVERACARGPLLVHFWDCAQLNSVRTLPYLRGWWQRYADRGLTVIGVHSPRYPITRDPEVVADAVERFALEYPVAIDVEHRVWHDYGCEGWPSLFVWGPGGVLRWFHFGEGEYRDTEAAIRELLPEAEPEQQQPLPEPLDPVRASDAPGALVMPPSEELLPGGSLEQPWVGGEDGRELEVPYAAAGAYATADGLGQLRVTVDGDTANAREIPVAVPGLYQLASSRHHERHTLRLEVSEGVRIWSVAFAPGVPPAQEA